MAALNVQLLLTGNELMSGDIIDTNSVMLSKAFKDIGIDVSRRITVADSLTLLVDEISAISKQADILIINGGLGPTTDDLTSQALAKALNCTVEQNPQALKHLQQWAKQKNATLNKANLKQALLPVDSTIIDNSNGSAVGIQATLNQCEIYCTPGVPRELKVMFTEQILPNIQNKFSCANHAHTTRLHVFGYGESSLQELLDNTFPDWPESIEIGFRASSPTLELKLSTYDDQYIALKAEYVEKLKALLNDHILEEITDRPQSMAEHIISILNEKNMRITTAESCTGGLISSQLTEISGASKVFDAGLVTYSNAMKTKLLDVDEALLAEHGAVSQACVIAMAKGALSISGADAVIATSGIAGPTGGCTEKPVGTVWIAWGNKSHISTHCFHIAGTRSYVQKTATVRSLDLIRRFIIESKLQPVYLK